MSKKDNSKKDETEQVLTPALQAATYLKATKDEHFNFEKDNYFKVSCSSLKLNGELAGGLPTGAHRFIGVNSGGKTSCALDFLLAFLKDKGRRGVYFKCEGRLSPEIQARSGIKFTNDPEEWEEGTCLVFETNIYEVVFGFMGELVRNNPLKSQYFFIIDSVDGMILRDDMAKPLGEANKVAGGALITSVFLKKAGAALQKRGHVAVFVSQVRDAVSTNMYAPPPPRQGKASGGHAIEHGANVVIDFLHRTEKDLIREGAADKEDDGKEAKESSDDNKKAKIIGHWCKIKLIKTDNEKNGTILRYPIKYGRTGGNSVWREYEIADKLIEWEMLKKATAKTTWFEFEPKILEELQKIDPDCPAKVQGQNAIRVMLEEHPLVTDYLYKKFSVLNEI